jgi:hypothetical protein
MAAQPVLIAEVYKMHRLQPASSAAVLIAIAGALTLGSPVASAQEVPEHQLTKPDAAYPEGFGSVRGVRETADGKVIVADGLGQALILLDLDAGTADTIGRVGGGPEEYQTPDALYPLPDEGTLLLDLGNGRLTQLASDLSFGETMPIAKMPEQRGPGMMAMQIIIPRGVDSQGRVYFQGTPRPVGGTMPDSGAILRLDRATGAIDTVGKVKLQESSLQESGSAGNRNVRMMPRPLTSQDAWAVSWDGRVAVARSGEYHLEWILPDGKRVAGKPLRFEPLRVTGADKEAWVETLTGGLAVMINAGGDGRMQTSFSRGGAVTDANVDDYEWPELKPAFPGNAVSVTRTGEAWVERHVKAGQSPSYDVFDAKGELVRRVRLPEGREIAAFGDGTIYLTWMDDFDFEWLERYTLP